MSAAEVLATVAKTAEGKSTLLGMMVRERADVSDLLSDLATVDGPEVIEATETLLDLQLALDRVAELNRTIKEGIDRLQLLAESAKMDALTLGERRAAVEQLRLEKAAREAAVRARAPKVNALLERARRLAWDGSFRVMNAARAFVARRRSGLSLSAAAWEIGLSATTLRNIEEAGGNGRSAYKWRVCMARAYNCPVESLGGTGSGDDFLDVDLVVLEEIIAAREAREAA